RSLLKVTVLFVAYPIMISILFNPSGRTMYDQISRSVVVVTCTVALPKGQRIVLMGRNGSGKSTFFLHCNGILRPKQGQILFDHTPLRYDRAALKTLRQQVGVVFQQADDQLFSANVAQDISFGPLNLGLEETIVWQRIEEVAEMCELHELLDRPIHALSGGQKARVALAGVLAMYPDVLLIDEPTASLDPVMRRQIFRIFERLHEEGKTLILATHEYEVARYWADYVVLMDRGYVLAADTPEQIFAQGDLLISLGLHEPWYTDLR
ncbi:MAG: ABC transporter ATP-binding protein, partial [Chloroflexota bacterium]